MREREKERERVRARVNVYVHFYINLYVYVELYIFICSTYELMNVKYGLSFMLVKTSILFLGKRIRFSAIKCGVLCDSTHDTTQENMHIVILVFTI